MRETKRYSATERTVIAGLAAVLVGFSAGALFGLLAAAVVVSVTGIAVDHPLAQACVYATMILTGFVTWAAAQAEMDRREREGRA